MKITNFFLAIVMLTLLYSCSSGSDDNPSANSRVVKYELTGTYSAPLQVIYTNEDGITQSIDDVTLPWSKEVTVKEGVVTVGLSSSFQTVDATMAGRTLTGKIFVGGLEKQSSSVIANSSGAIVLSALVHAL